MSNERINTGCKQTYGWIPTFSNTDAELNVFVQYCENHLRFFKCANFEQNYPVKEQFYLPQFVPVQEIRFLW